MPTTEDPVAGIVTHFALSNGTLPAYVDISRYLDSVEPSSETDELDGTNFQGGSRVLVPGFETTTYSLGGKWSSAAHAFWVGVKGKTNLNFEYGPQGDMDGNVRIYGKCNVKNYSGPISGVDDITTYTAELAINSQTEDGVFPSVAPTEATREEEKKRAA